MARHRYLYPRLFSCVTDPPDGVRGVVGNQQRAVRSSGDRNRPPPDIAIVDDETGHEVFTFTTGMSTLMQRHTDQLVAHTNGPVPGAMLGREKISLDIPLGIVC